MTEAESNTEYAYWTAPGNGFTVTYSLGVFHEIDFQVSEGFRRIPHGGIETGGLLFGRLEQEGNQLSARIEAFRTIDCEHASGPSFNLSEQDVAGVRQQLAAAASDPELKGLEALGWFVAHTRSPLEMNEREAALFGELFPGPGRMLLLVKPERFQATRFAFIMRAADGGIDRDAAATAIILPLPGRTARSAQGPAASIPAPVQGAPPGVPAPPAKQAPAAAAPNHAPTPAAPKAPPAQAAPNRLASAMARSDVTTGAESSAPSFWREVPAQGERKQPVVRIGEPSPPPPPPAEVEEESTALTVRDPALEDLRPPGRERITRKMPRGGGLSPLWMAALLLLAAALGCGVGYFAYLQLPSPTIPLTLQREPASATSGLATGTATLIVSWPSEETRDALFATIRVNDGEAIPLSTRQKDTGRVSIPVHGDDVKIELTAQRRWRDSRGIVRYVRAQPATP